MMKTEPYALTTDGSNDKGLIKMNPLAVGYFDDEKHKFSLNYWIYVIGY